jgi:hypothetical protein
MTNLTKNMISSVALNIANVLCGTMVNGKHLADIADRDEICSAIECELADTDFNDYDERVGA